jgi:hypothetical protein
VGAVVALVEDYGVEGVAARLHPHPLQDAPAPAGLQGEAVDEHLGDGLEGERQVVVPRGEDLAVRGREADRERLLLRLRVLGLEIAEARGVIVDDLIVVQRQVPPVQLLQPPVYPLPDLLVWHVGPPSGVLL